MNVVRRCAIYTRKSTDEGLEQEFNSLHAQREACEAFIESQRHEGWRVLPEAYDDGGCSGATMVRPGLTRLLKAIASGRIDVVVVYKVDRLTRSLSDFSRIVDAFDASGVSFVSVTQQFNTTTSMGRLTLNVLLSFAQFEREVTAERIRDKIAASKKKGMWMGGVVPLGYDVVDRKLIVNDAEAKTVRTLFRLYVEQANTRLVMHEAEALGLRTKPRRLNNGHGQGGIPFTRGHINKLLNNRIYRGEIVHKGAAYPGNHKAIIDRGAWDAVQERLQRNAVARRLGANASSPSLLAGLLYDAVGRRMVPSHATKGERRYRYYVSKSPDHGSASDAVLRLPATEIEQAVIQRVGAFLRDKAHVIDVVVPVETCVSRTLSSAAFLADRLETASPVDQRSVLLDFLNRVEVHQDRVRIQIRSGALRATLGASPSAEHVGNDGSGDPEELELELLVQLKRGGMAMKLVIADERERSLAPDPNLIAAVAQARVLFNKLRNGEAQSVRQLAKINSLDPGDVSRLMVLAFLAPDIVEAILEGRQPVDLTASRLKRLPELPCSWDDQRRILGFHRH